MKKAELTVLGDTIYPKTKASVVSHEHTNIEETLYEAKQTPATITQTSVVDRVGLGDDIDLSFCTQEGFYENASLTGNSSVNLIQESSKKEIILPYTFGDNRHVVIEDTRESGAIHNITMKGQTLVNLFDGRKMAEESYYTYENLVLTNATGADGSAWNEKASLSDQIKPNTKYLIMCKNVANNSGKLSLNIRVDETSFIVSTTVNPKGEYISVVTTPENVVGLRIKLTGTTKAQMMLNIIEYQEGMENWKIPYFEGIQSVNLKGVVSYEHAYRNHLIDPDISKAENKIPNSVVDGDWNILTWNLEDYTVVSKPTIFKYDTYGDDIFYIRMNIVKLLDTTYPPAIVCGRVGGYDQSFLHGTEYNQLPLEEEVIFSRRVLNSVPTTEFRDINLCFGYHRRDIEAKYKVKNLVFVNLTKEYGKGNEPTQEWCDANIKFEKDNETHYSKASIATLDESIELHSVGSQADTIDLMTGKLNRKICKLNLKDVVKQSCWNLYPGSEKNGTIAFHCLSNMFFKTYVTNPSTFLCNSLPVAVGDTVVANDFECVGVGNNYFKIRIAISKLSEPTVNGLVEYLEQNDVVVYGLTSNEEPFDVNFSIKNQNNQTINRLMTYNKTTNLRPLVEENSLLPVICGQDPTYRVNIRPSAKYTIVATPDGNEHTASPITFNLGGSSAVMSLNNRMVTIWTPSTLKNNLLTMSGRGHKLSEVMVVEGEPSKDIPFFEGMCSANSPALINIGENLFDANEYQRAFGNAVKVFADGTMESLGDIRGGNHNLYFASPMKAALKPNTTYTFCLFNLEESGQAIRSEGCLTTKSSELGIGSIPVGGIGYRVFTTNDHNFQKGVCFKVFTANNTGQKGRYKAMIVEGDVRPTTYVPYLSNSTTVKHLDDSVVTLRSLPNGVCDTLNLKTGELVQRIYEFKVTPERVRDFTIYGNFIDNFHVAFNGLPARKTWTMYWNNMFMRSDKILPADWTQKSINNIMTFSQYSGGNMRVYYGDVGMTLEGYKQWFEENQPIIQYELAEPIVKTIDVDDALLAYKNGYLHLSSDFLESSVPPKVEYQIQTTQSGVIQSNHDRLKNHSKRLLKLENLLLGQLVQQEYNRAKCTFLSQTRQIVERGIQMYHTKYELLSEFIEKKLYRSLEEVFEMLDVYFMLGDITDGEYDALYEALMPSAEEIFEVEETFDHEDVEV